MSYVNFNRLKDFAFASSENADPNTIYFTSDTHEIVILGNTYGSTNLTADGDVTLRAVTYIQDRTNSTDTSFTLVPNCKYLFGEKSSLTITLGAIVDTNIVNHYMFEFTSGETATTLSLPASIKWTVEPSIKPNKTYLISIENNLGIIQEWG